MYVPEAFAQRDRDEMLALMRAYSFATLVTTADDGAPFATHLPLLLTEDGQALEGHVARANPHWRIAEGRPALAVFAGPHHYVSPTWYEEANTVPTWNYLAVHATGVFRAVSDADEVRRLLLRTVEVYEAGRPQPWRPDAAMVEAMRGGVVAFRLEALRLQGKWKLNQNHSAARRGRVAAALEAEGGEDAAAVAAAMRRVS